MGMDILLPMLLSLKGFWRENGTAPLGLVAGRSIHLSVQKGVIINTIELLQVGEACLEL